MYFTDLQNCVKKILQRDVKFVVNDRVLREGKLILFNLKDYYIECMFIVKEDQKKVYELPAPFRIITQKDRVLFDYTVKTATKQNMKDSVAVKMIALEAGKKSKFYDNILTIEF